MCWKMHFHQHRITAHLYAIFSRPAAVGNGIFMTSELGLKRNGETGMLTYVATFRALLLAGALLSPVEVYAGADAGLLLTQAFEALGGSGGTLTAGSSSVDGRTMARSLTEQALALDPKDPYNLVFAAVFMAAAGKRDEALKIARANVKLLPASYNLAAIYAQNGQRERALAFLKRHFYQYERYQSVREKEMMEARVDAVFDSLRAYPAFIALTRDADGRLPMPMKPIGVRSRANE